jgi:putative nicotinate phosphoribosyltransferase
MAQCTSAWAARNAAQFDHFFRHNPDYGDHQAGYCINAGLEWLLDWMRTARVRPADLDHLRSQRDRTGRQMFDEPFLKWLSAYGNFDAISLSAIPEGRVVHPNEPLTVVRGPLGMAQILETPLLNLLNYQTLIATKAARIHASARGGTVLEFGMRRGHAQGVNPAAALIGGATSAPTSVCRMCWGIRPRARTRQHGAGLRALGEVNWGLPCRRRFPMTACCWWIRSIRSRAACPTPSLCLRNCGARVTSLSASGSTQAI